MELGKLGVWFFFDRMSAVDAATFARRVEAAGYGTLWAPEAFGREALSASSWLLAATEKLNIATGIANIYGRDALGMANAQKTLDEQSGGRFVLGIGVSHQPLVEGLRGHDYTKPYSFMRTYLDLMAKAPYSAPVLEGAGTTIIGALHPKMLRLAADRTAGAHPYLMPPEHTAFAREIMGKGPLLCPEQKVLLTQDAEKARAVARASIAIYLSLPNYRRSLMRFGVTESDFDNGGSDKLVDMIVAWGDVDTIKARIQAHFDAGADHVCIQPLHPDGDAAGGQPDWNVLDALAPGTSAPGN
ncbi:MAG: putative F420-dependent oxidoreductase [Hyphomicrobiaceae bacterium]|jgi:probable F420-dependent oxidoreductase